jgi:hypothetical protein
MEGLGHSGPGTPELEFLGDRWPRITYSVNGLSVRVQMLVNKGIIIQQFTVTNNSDSSENLDIVLDVDFLIQELDYMVWKKPLTRSYQEAPHNYGVLGMGSLDMNKVDEDPAYVGAVVGVFRDGDSLKLSLPENGRSIPILTGFSLKESKSLELTAAYRLQYIARSSHWKESILQSIDVDAKEMIKNSQIRLNTWPIPNDEKLSWHLRRNLEHILSVCSIPLGKDADGPVALTCGDFGDHRVCMSGSL